MGRSLPQVPRCWAVVFKRFQRLFLLHPASAKQNSPPKTKAKVGRTSRMRKTRANENKTPMGRSAPRLNAVLGYIFGSDSITYAKTFNPGTRKWTLVEAVRALENFSDSVRTPTEARNLGPLPVLRSTWWKVYYKKKGGKPSAASYVALLVARILLALSLVVLSQSGSSSNENSKHCLSQSKQQANKQP